MVQFPDKVGEQYVDVRIDAIDTKADVIKVGIKSSKPFKKYILIKAMIFPLINLVWLGSLLMFVGFIVSMIDRRKQGKRAR